MCESVSVATILDRYTFWTGGSPTPGTAPWPEAVAQIAGIIPDQLASKHSTWFGGLLPEGLAALALGTYILAAESGRPATQITIGEVTQTLSDPDMSEPDRQDRPIVNEPWAIRSWTARLAALGHDPDAGIQVPRQPGRNGESEYLLTYGDDAWRAFELGGYQGTALPDPVDALWLKLRVDCSPSPGVSDHVLETTFVRFGSVLSNAVEPALAALHRHGADVP